MRRARRNPKKLFTRRMKERLLIVLFVALCIFIFLIGKLVYIQKDKGEGYEKRVLSRQTYVMNMKAYRRGEIRDRNGTILARSELKYKLILDPNMLITQKNNGKDYIEPTKEALNKYFGYEQDAFMNILNERAESQYVILMKELDYNLVQDFKEDMKEKGNIKGVWFEEEYMRVYPYESLAPDVIGFVTSDNLGFWGIEKFYDNDLTGANGREFGYYNSKLDIERIIKPAINGNHVISSIDMNVQSIVQKHIREFNEEFGSKHIGIVIMNPNNGEILAMASDMEYDLNNPRDLTPFYTEAELALMSEEEKMEALNVLWGNYTISDGFEPGSTFKPFTVAAALEEGIVNDNSTFYCDGFEMAPTRINCNQTWGHGHITLEEAIMYSCNDALMQIAATQGRDLFYEYQNRFLFGNKTGIDLPGEALGILIPREGLNVAELATSSFGQSFTTTMIQMISGYSALINGGNYYKPHVVKEIINENGSVVRRVDKTLVKKVSSNKTAELLNRYLLNTVEGGTAKHAKVEGYAIGGKTATAQKIPREAKKYLVSFMGSVPALNPEMAIYIVIDEAQNVERQDSSSIATKLASKVLKEVLPALGIFPSGEIDYLLPNKNINEESDSDDNQENNQEIDDSNNSSQDDTNNQIDNTNENHGNQTNDGNQFDDDYVEYDVIPFDN